MANIFKMLFIANILSLHLICQDEKNKQTPRPARDLGDFSIGGTVIIPRHATGKYEKNVIKLVK